MKIIDIVGNRIKKLRDDKKETQADLAKALRVKRETVNQWENETRDLKTLYTVLLAEHFKTTCDYVLGYDSVRSYTNDYFLFLQEEVDKYKSQLEAIKKIIE